MNKISNLEVSRIGMGCMAFSHGYGQIPKREYSIEAIIEAYKLGCNFFDTAETYGDVLYHTGHNEEILGEDIHDFRDKVIVASKLHLHDEELVDGYDLYEVIKSHLMASLKRLQTSYLDIYYLHRINELVDNKEVAKVMGRLIEEGLINGWVFQQ